MVEISRGEVYKREWEPRTRSAYQSSFTVTRDGVTQAPPRAEAVAS
jgi:hypothetical protein